ncbi:MAG: hypothetical protein DRH90_17705 [Deltaproteobacteria bacterium]|nr:MAG: hypothetical protein DRH90_17705 [Deltaproteobacteria bacterium]
MSFTQDEYLVENTGELNLSYKGKEFSTEDLRRRISSDKNIFSLQDYNLVIKTFEAEAANWEEEDYALAYHYRDIYSTENFAGRVREQLNYYPGMHQVTQQTPLADPFYKNAKNDSNERLNFWNNAMDNPTSFNHGLRSRQGDFDYTQIFGSEASAKDRAENIGKMLSQCIPCFGRVLSGEQLLPDGDLLEVHALNIKVRTDLIDKITQLFDNPGFNIDVCELLKLLAGLCPADLIAISTLLSQYLAKLNIDVKFNLDFILQLIGPVLSPFLDSISEWLDKWIQLIVTPMVCVIDHINEVAITAQNAKIPFSQVSGSVESDIGLAAPGHKNASTENSTTFGRLGEGGALDVGTKTSWDAFETPDAAKYNPEKPEYPKEETQLAAQELTSPFESIDGFVGSSDDILEAWTPGVTTAERAVKDQKWKELRAKEYNKRQAVPPPLDYSDGDGKRWSKDDIPQSEKYAGGDWQSGGYHPVDRQKQPKANTTEYYVATPFANGMIQLRNILQGAIQYVKDWFTYITQMIYDLLGTDFGWMSKKVDSTSKKSRIIQMLSFVKAIIQAVSQNGLECGVDTNFDPAQLKFITEQVLNKKVGTRYKFEVQQDGTVAMKDPQASSLYSTAKAKQEVGNQESLSGADSKIRQDSVDSSIIIKSCFKDISSDDLAKVRNWIADFEERG